MNYILIWQSGNAKFCVRDIQQQMQNNLNIIYKDKEDGEYYLWDRRDSEPESISLSTVKDLLSDNPVINWGNHIFRDDTFNFILNKPSKCALSADKIECRKLLAENNIKVPETFYELNKVRFYPFIARPNKHCRGRDFYLINNEQDKWNLMDRMEEDEEQRDWYFQRVFNKDREYRVHVASGDILAVFRKGLQSDSLVCDNENGWVLREPRFYIPSLVNEAKKVMEVIGLDYGAVDIMYNSTNGSFAVCETNSDVELTPIGRKRHARYFDSILSNIL